MARIKSAIEVAMERTADIEGDTEGMRKEELILCGRKIGAALINQEEGCNPQGELSRYSEEERVTVQEGVLKTISMNLKLPDTNEDLMHLDQIEKALGKLGSKEDIAPLFRQVKDAFSQYLQQKDHTEKTLKTRYEPQLRQKERMVTQQTGQNVRLTFESDPEFMAYLREELRNLKRQYEGALEQARTIIVESFRAGS